MARPADLSSRCDCCCCCCATGGLALLLCTVACRRPQDLLPLYWSTLRLNEQGNLLCHAAVLLLLFTSRVVTKQPGGAPRCASVPTVISQHGRPYAHTDQQAQHKILQIKLLCMQISKGASKVPEVAWRFCGSRQQDAPVHNCSTTGRLAHSSTCCTLESSRLVAACVWPQLVLAGSSNSVLLIVSERRFWAEDTAI